MISSEVYIDAGKLRRNDFGLTLEKQGGDFWHNFIYFYYKVYGEGKKSLKLLQHLSFDFLWLILVDRKSTVTL